MIAFARLRGVAMNSLRTKSFTTIVLTLIGASFLAPSSSSATARVG